MKGGILKKVFLFITFFLQPQICHKLFWLFTTMWEGCFQAIFSNVRVLRLHWRLHYKCFWFLQFWGIRNMCISYSLLVSFSDSLVTLNLFSFLCLWLVLMKFMKFLLSYSLALRWTHWLPLVSTLWIVIPKALGKTAHNVISITAL